MNWYWYGFVGCAALGFAIGWFACDYHISKTVFGMVNAAFDKAMNK